RDLGRVFAAGLLDRRLAYDVAAIIRQRRHPDRLEGLLQADDAGALVLDLDMVELLELVFPGRFILRVGDAFEGIFHVLGRYRAEIAGPFETGHQREGDRSGIGLLDLLRTPRRYGVALAHVGKAHQAHQHAAIGDVLEIADLEGGIEPG